MAGGKSDYLEPKILDYMLGGVPWTPPTSYFLALSAAGSYQDNFVTVDEIGEIVGNGYERVEIPNDLVAGFTATTLDGSSVKKNLNDIVFPTATGDWGYVYAAYLIDADGNVYFGADLAAPYPVASGDTFRIFAGTFIFTED